MLPQTKQLLNDLYISYYLNFSTQVQNVYKGVSYKCCIVYKKVQGYFGYY